MNSAKFMWAGLFLGLVIVSICVLKTTKTFKTAAIITTVCLLIPITWVGRICIIYDTTEPCAGHITWMPVYLFVMLLIAIIVYILWIFAVLIYRKLNRREDGKN